MNKKKIGMIAINAVIIAIGITASVFLFKFGEEIPSKREPASKVQTHEHIHNLLTEEEKEQTEMEKMAQIISDQIPTTKGLAPFFINENEEESKELPALWLGEEMGEKAKNIVELAPVGEEAMEIILVEFKDGVNMENIENDMDDNLNKQLLFPNNISKDIKYFKNKSMVLTIAFDEGTLEQTTKEAINNFELK